jgi:hypothetical protein
MKFLVRIYSCLQNPWLWGYRPPIPGLSVLNRICWTPRPPNKIPVYAADVNYIYPPNSLICHPFWWHIIFSCNTTSYHWISVHFENCISLFFWCISYVLHFVECIFCAGWGEGLVCVSELTAVLAACSCSWGHPFFGFPDCGNEKQGPSCFISYEPLDFKTFDLKQGNAE